MYYLNLGSRCASMDSAEARRARAGVKVRRVMIRVRAELEKGRSVTGVRASVARRTRMMMM